MSLIGGRVGPWTLLGQLGKGGNATVWKAQRSVGEDVIALKVLDARKPTSEPYKRFRDEVKILQALAGEPGILPLLDYDLPDALTRQQPAWLAMPLAVPIQDALGDRPNLEDVVAVGAEIATTLARLAERGISHRDIKPGNLYEYSGRFVIGDFGLVRFPEKEAITTDERSLGPRNFLAPEMITNPEDADGSAADVYSLAKTIWVLATDRQWPPPGHQLVESTSTNLSSRLPHPRVRELDWVVERATAHDPSERITMREMATTLGAWLKPELAQTAVPDLATIGERYQGHVADRERLELRRGRWMERARQLLNSWAETLAPIAETLRANGFGARFKAQDNNVTFAQAGRQRGSARKDSPLWCEGRSILVSPPGDRELLLWIGLAVRLLDDGGIRLTVGTQLRTTGDRRDMLSLEERQTHIESADVRHHVAELGTLLAVAVPAAMQRFTDAVEESRASANPLSPLRLSRNGSAVAVWLNAGSQHAVEGFESINPVEMQAQLGLTEQQLIGGVDEIEARGWIDVYRALSGAHVGDIVSLKPIPLLFIDTDPYLKSWDARSDAERLAILAVELGETQAIVRDLAERLGWEPRRLNPAIYVLVQAGDVDPSAPSSGSYPFAYDDLRITARTRRLIAPRDRRAEGES